MILVFFKNKIEDGIPTLQTTTVVSSEKKPKKKKKASTYWIWSAIGLVALGLGYMSYKMVKEMGDKQ